MGSCVIAGAKTIGAGASRTDLFRMSQGAPAGCRGAEKSTRSSSLSAPSPSTHHERGAPFEKRTLLMLASCSTTRPDFSSLAADFWVYCGISDSVLGPASSPSSCQWPRVGGGEWQTAVREGRAQILARTQTQWPYGRSYHPDIDSDRPDAVITQTGLKSLPFLSVHWNTPPIRKANMSLPKQLQKTHLLYVYKGLHDVLYITLMQSSNRVIDR